MLKSLFLTYPEMNIIISSVSPLGESKWKDKNYQPFQFSYKNSNKYMFK